jgi:Ca2+-transporting ATPase
MDQYVENFFYYLLEFKFTNIFFVDILMDGPPAQSLGVEPVDEDVMRQPPRKKNAPILTPALVMRVVISAIVMVAGTLFIYVKEMRDGIVTARDTTMVRIFISLFYVIKVYT